MGEKPCIENIDTINQPSATYAYPKREQSGGMRSFQSKWFAEFRWLHYDPETDSALCFTCVQAYKQNKMTSSKDEPAFFKNGYRNWNNGPANFREHAKSNTHLQSCDKLAKPSTSISGNVDEILDAVSVEERHHNRQMLLRILKAVLFLGILIL